MHVARRAAEDAAPSKTATWSFSDEVRRRRAWSWTEHTPPACHGSSLYCTSSQQYLRVQTHDLTVSQQNRGRAR